MFPRDINKNNNNNCMHLMYNINTLYAVNTIQHIVHTFRNKDN